MAIRIPRGAKHRRPPTGDGKRTDCHVGLRPPRNDVAFRGLFVNRAVANSANWPGDSGIAPTEREIIADSPGCGDCLKVYCGTVITVPLYNKVSRTKGNSML